MVKTIIMPKLGQTVEEATLVKWHKKTGDKVKKGDILFEIETDKAVLEVECFFDGTLLKILTKEDETVPVMSPVAFVGNPGEPIPDLPQHKKTPAPPFSKKPPPERRPEVEQAAQPLSAPETVEPVRDARRAVSPRARALASGCCVGIDRIRGTGPGGRVVEKDVLDYLAGRNYDSIKITPAAKSLAKREKIDILEVKPQGDRITIEDIRHAIAEKPAAMSKIRQVIAERMTLSYTTAPHFFVTVSVDMTDLLAFRKDLKREGKPYSVTDFILKSAALALVRFPALNSSTDGRNIRRHARVHIGMAVAIKDGLVVPVIRNAHKISLLELHNASNALALKARKGVLTPDEMTGSTFTVSNMGMLNVESFTAIINPGESAILAVSSTVRKPVVVKERITIRSIMKMTLASDHRVVDGETASGFVNAVRKMLEDVNQWKNMIL